MFARVVQRIPTGARKSIAVGLLVVAGYAVLFGVLSIMVFAESTEEKCTGHLWAKKCVDVDIPLAERLPSLLGSIGLIAGALLCLFVAFQLIATQGHLKKYHAILTGVESIAIQKIADITHSRPTKVRREIQSLIDANEIDDFYIDFSRDAVVSKKYVPKSSHKTVSKCSECGGNNEVIVGITRHCSFCGQPLLLGTT